MQSMPESVIAPAPSTGKTRRVHCRHCQEMVASTHTWSSGANTFDYPPFFAGFGSGRFPIYFGGWGRAGRPPPDPRLPENTVGKTERVMSLIAIEKLRTIIQLVYCSSNHVTVHIGEVRVGKQNSKNNLLSWIVFELFMQLGLNNKTLLKGTVSWDFLINFFFLITKSVLFVKPLIVFKFFCKTFVW